MAVPQPTVAGGGGGGNGGASADSKDGGGGRGGAPRAPPPSLVLGGTGAEKPHKLASLCPAAAVAATCCHPNSGRVSPAGGHGEAAALT